MRHLPPIVFGRNLHNSEGNLRRRTHRGEAQGPLQGSVLANDPLNAFTNIFSMREHLSMMWGFHQLSAPLLERESNVIRVRNGLIFSNVLCRVIVGFFSSMTRIILIFDRFYIESRR